MAFVSCSALQAESWKIGDWPLTWCTYISFWLAHISISILIKHSLHFRMTPEYQLPDLKKMRMVHRTKFMPSNVFCESVWTETRVGTWEKVNEGEKKFCSSSNFIFLIQKVFRFLSATFCENLFQTSNNQMLDYKSHKVLFAMVLKLNL